MKFISKIKFYKKVKCCVIRLTNGLAAAPERGAQLVETPEIRFPDC